MIVTAIETEEFKITEIGPLPQDWEVEPFDNVRVKAIGRIPPSIPVSGYQTQGKYPIIDQSANYIAGYTDDDSRILREQLPVIIFGDHTRIFKFVNFPFAIGADGTKIIYPNSDAYNPKFLYYYFLSLDIPSRGYNRHFRILREQKIARPPPPEQRAIAYVLSSVQTAIEKTEAAIKATRELKKSLMRYLFTYGPVNVSEAESVPLKETEIAMVPEGWEVINLSEYCNFTTGKLNANQAVPGALFPFFTCSQETYRIDRYSFDCEAVLLAGNNARGIYSVKYYSGKFDAYQRTYVITISDNSKLDYLYLKNALETKLEELRVGSIGTSTKFLTLKMLLNLRIPLPPLPLQIQMANLFSSVAHKAEAEENKKKALEALFRTLLSKLMTGKTRVNDLEVSV